MAMDRAERIGLGTAVGGHALLLGAFAVAGLLTADRIVKPQPISVTLDGPVADVSTAPDPVQEEPAPAAAAAEPEPAEVEPAPAMKIEKPTPKPLPKAVEKQKPAPQAKPAPKPLLKQAATPPKPKSAAQPTPKQATPKQANPRPFSKSFEDAVRGTGSNPQPTQGTATNQGAFAEKTAAQIRSATSNSIAAEVRPFILGCAPVTSDKSSLRVFVALSIDQTAKLVDADVYDVKGVTSDNQAQVERMKRCVLDSLKAASPYNLDPNDYDVWRNHKVQLKVNFK